MVQIQNTDAINAIRNSARLTISEGFPSKLKDDVQAVIDMTPRNHRLLSVVKHLAVINSTTGTIYTTPTTRDFYLCAIDFSMVKDATSTSVRSDVSATIDGVPIVLVGARGLTLTAQQVSKFCEFNRPMKIDRGTTIVLNHNADVANITGMATIYGFETD